MPPPGQAAITLITAPLNTVVQRQGIQRGAARVPLEQPSHSCRPSDRSEIAPREGIPEEVEMRGIFGPLVAASAATTVFACAIETEDENNESVSDPEHDTVMSAILAGPRPLFQLPFPCGQQWRMDTWAHAPALDMVREPNQVGTEGALLVAAADGVVNQSFRHGDAGNMIQINHGGQWFTTYLHLQSRAVSAGQRVAKGQAIGRVGRDGPTANNHPHLHFELAIDANGDGRASWGAANTERVRPWFNGVEYGQSNGQTWRNTTSFNCGGGHLPRIAVDYDGDGRADLAVWRPAEGNWWLRPSASAPSVTQWGLPSDIPVPADYDGDGRGDLAVWRPAEGNWYIDRSSTTNPSVTQWGLPGDIPVPADYDGDGLGDLGIWRPADGNWWIDRSTTTNPSVTQWGQPGDIPLPADFDGDGLADLGIWRPAEGNWYIKRSTSPTPTVTQWGLPGDIPVP